MLIQVLNIEGDNVALYETKVSSDANYVQGLIKHNYDSAIAKKQHYLESNHEEQIDVQEEADSRLIQLKIVRVYVEELIIDTDAHIKTKNDLIEEIATLKHQLSTEQSSSKTLRSLLNNCDKDVIKLKLIIADDLISKKLNNTTIIHRLGAFDKDIG